MRIQNKQAATAGFTLIEIMVVVIIIAVVVFSNRGAIEAPDGTDVSVDIDLPRPELPDAPKMPDLPDVPPVNPPTLPPEPAPAT